MPKPTTAPVYWRNGRVYLDARAYADVGGTRESLIAPAEKLATKDPLIARELAARRIRDLEERRRLKLLQGIPRTTTLGAFAQYHLEQKAPVETRVNLAARRGKLPLAITLGSGEWNSVRGPWYPQFVKPRFRLFAALLALFAFSAATAESVWASTCAMPAAQTAVSEAARQTGCTTGADPAAESQRSDQAPSDAPHCPFTFASGASCVAGASLPANVAVQLLPPSEGDLAPVFATPVAARLLVDTLFRPPRA